MKTALTIAGSDSSGGAGIQADIKTMTVHGVYAMSAITAITAQNTVGVKRIAEVAPSMLADQLDCVFSDIFPDAVKIGMVSNGSQIETIAQKLNEYGAKNIVLDPVMVATSGASLSGSDALSAMKTHLLPMASVVTPNLFEASVLSGIKISSAEDMMKAAESIFSAFHCAVLLKGGHSINDANDLLFTQSGSKWFFGDRIENSNTHGTGCTLSSAICANLAKRIPLETAIQKAKQYISGALRAQLNLGHGSGPLNHAFAIDEIIDR